MICFQCPECGFGHHEIGHLVVETEIHCLVCYDEEGRLVRVLEDWCDPFPGYHLYYPSRRHASPAFALLVETLRYRG